MKHWKLQRISALALIPLTLWLIYAALSLEIRNYTLTLAWFGNVKNTTTKWLFFSEDSGVEARAK